MQEFKECLAQPENSLPVAAIKALTSLIKHSQARTMMELEVHLRSGADHLKKCDSSFLEGKTAISLTAGYVSSPPRVCRHSSLLVVAHTGASCSFDTSRGASLSFRYGSGFPPDSAAALIIWHVAGL